MSRHLNSNYSLIVLIHFTLAMSINLFEHLIDDFCRRSMAVLGDDVSQARSIKIISFPVNFLNHTVSVKKQRITRFTLNSHEVVLSFRKQTQWQSVYSQASYDAVSTQQRLG